jgi:hypothetical protein
MEGVSHRKSRSASNDDNVNLREKHMTARRTFLLGAAALAMAAVFSGPAAAQSTIKIGELNSYKNFPAFLEPYKKGWELALDEINKSGAASTAASWRWCRATTTATRETRCAWPKS